MDETRRVLLTTDRIRRRYHYPNSAVEEYLRGIAQLGKVATPTAVIRVVRDPADDMIVACAVAAAAGYIITRDDDLLSLKCYNQVRVITPEEFHSILRED